MGILPEYAALFAAAMLFPNWVILDMAYPPKK
jgi:hypothetical protein